MGSSLFSISFPTQELTKSSVLEPFPWEDKLEQAFLRQKQVLQEPSVLGLPTYSKPFALFVHLRDNGALGTLMQETGQ